MSRNKTLVIDPQEYPTLLDKTITITNNTDIDYTNKIICQDIFKVLDFLPSEFIDLLIADPPYNMSKKFGSHKFSKLSNEAYNKWTETWLSKIIRCLKPNASIYICSEWSTNIREILEKYFIIKNRITWERDKGRGAKTNWKNCSEDIWFCTMSDHYTFNIDAVKLKRKVYAPYKEKGKPKDWANNIRLTYPSNLWTDVTVPFWSMPENTDHPTQKPEKLIAKLILASSNKDDMVFDPFLGSGTTAVTASKLGRRYCGVEIDPKYCVYAIKRLEQSMLDKRISGYDGVFKHRSLL